MNPAPAILLPCPFCDDAATLVFFAAGPDSGWRCGCRGNCVTFFRRAGGMGDDVQRDSAVADWNTRAPRDSKIANLEIELRDALRGWRECETNLTAELKESRGNEQVTLLRLKAVQKERDEQRDWRSLATDDRREFWNHVDKVKAPTTGSLTSDEYLDSPHDIHKPRICGECGGERSVLDNGWLRCKQCGYPGQ